MTTWLPASRKRRDSAQPMPVPPLTAPAAYLRDALKRVTPPPPAQTTRTEKRFVGLGTEDRAQRQREFEDSQLEGIMEPIARAWRRDSPASKIASPIFFRWLAGRSATAEPSEKDLVEFAVARGMLNLS